MTTLRTDTTHSGITIDYANGSGFVHGGSGPLTVYSDDEKAAINALTDADGDKLSFSWWFQEFPDETGYPEIKNPESAKVSFTVPDNSQGNIYHLICEIHDNGPFSLTAYKRVIISVE